MKNWPELILIKDIQVFIGFTNFYQRFIKGFSRFTTLLTFLLKITGLSKLAPKTLRVNDNEVVSSNSSKANKTFVNLSKNKKSKNLMRMPNIGAIKKPIFLIFNTKKAFNQLRLAFIKAPIF